MRTKAFLSAGVALIVLLVSLAPPAAADDDEEFAASGTLVPTVEGITTMEEEDNRCVIEVSGAGFDLTDTLDGSATIDVTLVQEAACAEIALLTFEGDGTFVGTVATPHAHTASTFDFEFEGSIDTMGIIEFELEIEEGTVGLADLDGELTFRGLFPFGPITYSGELELDD